MKNYFIQTFGCNILGFLFIGVNGACFVRRSNGIWVNGCSYVESVTFMRKCSNISLWGRWVKLVTLPQVCVDWSVFLVLKNMLLQVKKTVFWQKENSFDQVRDIQQMFISSFYYAY
jgi:hypothetical protein